jgi:hypothetical protein
MSDDITPSEALKQVFAAIDGYARALLRQHDKLIEEKQTPGEWLTIGRAAVRLGYSATHDTRKVIQLCYENKLLHLKNDSGKPYKVYGKSIDLYLDARLKELAQIP